MKTILTVLAMLAAQAGDKGQEPLPRAEELTAFDPNAVVIQRREGRWTLEAGGTLLKDAGRREDEVRQVRSLMLELKLNQHGVIGRPRPIMEYWLSSGQPPRSLPRGVRILPLNLDKLRVEQAQGFWVLREQTRVLFNFGTDEQEARQALAVIHKYGFDRIGVVGQAIPAMLIFVAGDRRPDLVRVEHKEEPAPPKPPVPQASATPSFYPTPILPALASPGQLIDRGRPSRLNPVAVEANVAVNRYAFDVSKSQVRRKNADWILAVGELELANFGAGERWARLAQAVLMHYHVTELVTVGTGEQTLRYYLVNGQAPRGLMTGVMADRFVNDRLQLRVIGERQCLAEGGHPVFDCGTRVEDAQHMLNVVRRFGFDHVLRIGQTDQQALTMLVRSY